MLELNDSEKVLWWEAYIALIRAGCMTPAKYSDEAIVDLRVRRKGEYSLGEGLDEPTGAIR